MVFLEGAVVRSGHCPSVRESCFRTENHGLSGRSEVSGQVDLTFRSSFLLIQGNHVFVKGNIASRAVLGHLAKNM